MSFAVAFSILMSTGTGPIADALAATEAPRALRAAFVVELKSDRATRVFEFDPRWEAGSRWRLVQAAGEDGDLDQAAAAWGAEPSPDGRLFPDDLRASLGDQVDVRDEGLAWRIGFRHRPSANDGELDRWAIERLAASAWLDPEGEQFLRIDYSLPRSVRGPEGGRLTRYDQTWYLETEPRYQVSLVTAFSIDVEGRAAFAKISRGYSAEIKRVEVFFATDDAEREFLRSASPTGGESSTGR